MLAQRQAERQFPVRVRIAVPPEGLRRQLEIIHAWLDETCGAEGFRPEKRAMRVPSRVGSCDQGRRQRLSLSGWRFQVNHESDRFALGEPGRACGQLF